MSKNQENGENLMWNEKNVKTKKMVAAMQAKQGKIARFSLVFLECRCKLYGYLTNTVTLFCWLERKNMANQCYIHTRYVILCQCTQWISLLCDSLCVLCECCLWSLSGLCNLYEGLCCCVVIWTWKLSNNEPNEWTLRSAGESINESASDSVICCNARYESERQCVLFISSFMWYGSRSNPR